jgi:hypothetical protein
MIPYEFEVIKISVFKEYLKILFLQIFRTVNSPSMLVILKTRKLAVIFK